MIKLLPNLHVKGLSNPNNFRSDRSLNLIFISVSVKFIHLLPTSQKFVVLTNTE